MKKKAPGHTLSRRERQAMDFLYELGSATAAELHAKLPDPPSYSAVRSMLRLLEQKGHVKHAQDGPRYVYSPTVPRESARRTALDHVVKTFFDGSIEDAVAALLEAERSGLDPASVERIRKAIAKARGEGR